MAATTLLQVMDGIEVRLQTISGLRTTEWIPDQISPPHAFVGVPPIDDYRATFGRGRWGLQPTVTVLVGSALDRPAQRKLAEFASVSGANSIPAAIEGDRTLGGVVDECFVASFRPLGIEEVGEIGYHGGEFTLTVMGRGA